MLVKTRVNAWSHGNQRQNSYWCHPHQGFPFWFSGCFVLQSCQLHSLRPLIITYITGQDLPYCIWQRFPLAFWSWIIIQHPSTPLLIANDVTWHELHIIPFYLWGQNLLWELLIGSTAIVFFLTLGRLAGNIKLKSGQTHLSIHCTTLLPFKKLLSLVGSLNSLLQYIAITESQHSLFLYFWSTEWWKHLAVKVPQPLMSPTRKAMGHVRSSKPREEASCYAHLELVAARTAGGRTGVSRCMPKNQFQRCS